MGETRLLASDNRDEMGWRIFMVLGKLDKEQPEFCIRVGANGSFIDLSEKVNDIFDDADELHSIVRVKQCQDRIYTKKSTYKKNLEHEVINIWNNLSNKEKTEILLDYFGYIDI